MTQDICLTLNQLFVILKCILMKPQNGTFICWNWILGILRTLYYSVLTDNTTVETSNQSNICVYNFTKLGCNFSHSAPVTTHQLLLQINCISHQDLPPTPIGMSFTLVKKLLEDDDLRQNLQHTCLKPWT